MGLVGEKVGMGVVVVVEEVVLVTVELVVTKTLPLVTCHGGRVSVEQIVMVKITFVSYLSDWRVTYDRDHRCNSAGTPPRC